MGEHTAKVTVANSYEERPWVLIRAAKYTCPLDLEATRGCRLRYQELMLNAIICGQLEFELDPESVQRIWSQYKEVSDLTKAGCRKAIQSVQKDYTWHKRIYYIFYISICTKHISS